MVKITLKKGETYTRLSIILGLIPLATQLLVSIIFMLSRSSLPVLTVLAGFIRIAPYILGGITLIGLVLGIIALKKSVKTQRSLPIFATTLNGLIFLNYLISIGYALIV